jgi:hypothetical protein
MTTAAEQYRQLVDRLQSINEELKIGDIDPRNGKKILSAMTDSDGNVVRSGTGEIWNVKYGEPDKKPELAPTPAAAEEPTVTPVTPPSDVKPTALDPIPEPAPTPAPEVKPEEKCGPEVKEKIKQQTSFKAAFAMARQAECPDFEWCQIVTVPGEAATPAGDPWFSAPGMGKGSVVTRDGKPTFANVKEEEVVIEDPELDRIREIAGTQVVAEANEVPEIKASSKDKAIEIARKKGIKRFKWCGKFKTNLSKKPIDTATPEPKVPSAAVVGNPNISRQTAPGNPNTRPGSLRDRAAQANAARRPDAPKF